MVRNAQGEVTGVAHDLGHALAKQLGVPAKVVEFERLVLVVDAVKNAEVDFTFTNASEARAKVVSFTPPLIQLELGYLVPSGRYWEEAGRFDPAALDRLDALWLQAATLPLRQTA